MLGDLSRSGFEIVKDHEDADAIVVNTCSFVEDAKTESLEVKGMLRLLGSRLHCAFCAVPLPKLECTPSIALSSSSIVAAVGMASQSWDAADTVLLHLYLQAIFQAAQLKSDGKAQRVIVTGCMAQRYAQELAGTQVSLYVRLWEQRCVLHVSYSWLRPCYLPACNLL